MKKHFLILMLMALLPMAGFALTLDASKFSAPNIDYGSTALPAVSADGYTVNTHYKVVYDRFYTSNTGAGETLVGAGGANLKVANNGIYFIKVEGLGDYDGQTVYVDFWIKGIPVTIDFADVSKEFGEKDADHPITYTLTRKGEAWTPTEAELTDLGLTYSRAEGENVVTATPFGYAYSFEWTNKNYTVTRATGDESVYRITPKNIASTAKITKEQGDVVYTGNEIKGVYTVLDKEGGITLEADKDYTVATVTNVTSTTFKPTITFQGNYAGSIEATVGFKVTPAPIVVGVEDIEVVYDGATDYHNILTIAPAKVKFTYSGIVGADVANATSIKEGFTKPTSVVTKEAKAIDANEYELTISGGSASGNYAFAEYRPGKLTVKRAPLAIKAANASKSIGDADPTFEIVPVTGLTITGVTFTRESGETEGEYEITPVLDNIVITTGTGETAKNVTANYDPTVDETKGKLTIGATKIYVTIKDAEKFYGQEDPEFTYTVTGLKAGDELAAFEITREAGERPYAYSMTATVANPDPTKYSDVVVANGIFTIKKAQLEFTMGAMSIVKNPTEDQKTAALNKALVKVTGINNSDKADDLYTLTYDAGVDFADDNTNAAGVIATLDNSSTTGAKKLLTEGTKDYYAGDLYEIVTDKTTTPWTVSNTVSGKLIVGTGTVSAITFNSVDADYTTITGQAGETQDVSLKIDNRTREVPTGTAHTWAAQTWNAMVLPFEVTVGELSSQLGYAIVNRVNSEKTTEGNVVFKLEMDKIPANEPFCVKTTGAIADGYTISFTGKKIVAPGSEYPSVDAGQGYKFVGVYKGFTIDKTKSLFYFLRGDNANWAHIGTSSANTWNMVPFDAYIDQSGAASARELTFTFEEIDGTTTAIKAVDADVVSNRTIKEGWYTIGGMKLQSAPTQKGVYINNGKKIIVK